MRFPVTPEQWDEVRKIWKRLAGRRPTTERFVGRLRENAALWAAIVAASADAFAMEIGRTLIRGLSYEAESEERQEEMIFNVEHINRNGEKEQSYDELGKLTVDELGSLANAERRKIGAQKRKCQRICLFGQRKFDREFTRRLDFPIEEILDGTEGDAGLGPDEE